MKAAQAILRQIVDLINRVKIRAKCITASTLNFLMSKL